MRSRKAFTLVELLVVIGIILILMGMLMGGVMVAKNSAVKAKAAGLVSQVASAIEQYRSLNATYPELLKVPVAPVPAAWTDATAASITLNGLSAGDKVYDLAFVGMSAPAVSEDWWTAVNAALVYQLGSLAEGTAKNGLFTDPWGKVLRYRPSKWYPMDKASPLIDTAKPPNPDAFQLWSTGKDMVDAFGESGDDIANWQKP